MRNVWLVIKREYREHVRTKAFIISTILVPLIMGAVMFLPALASSRGASERRIVVVTSSGDFGRAVQESLAQRGERTGTRYQVEISVDGSPQNRERLRQRVLSREIHGFLWAADDALSSGTVQYAGRDVSDFIETAALQAALNSAVVKHRLQQRGVAADDVQNLMRTVAVDSTRVEATGETRAGGRAMFLTTFVLVMMLYVTVFMQGVAVMRAVLEEKSSRVVEVMLAAVNAKELMAGKILGVGAVGLTQTLIWSVVVLLFSLPSLLAAGSAFGGVKIPPSAVGAFIVFFVLGYLLYATLYAALGAMVNTEQEAQNLQFFVMMPLILSTALILPVLRAPSGTMAVVLSFIPFFTPIIMYVRMLVEQPPLWQLALSGALMLGTIYVAIVICSRIYRVGILMYGKRPTLPEIMKWLRYA